jgi:protein-tyrosine-phosphatase
VTTGMSEETIALSPEKQLVLRQAAERLQRQFAGVLNTEIVTRFFTDSTDRLVTGATTTTTWVPLLAERFARDRLRALVRLERPDVASATPSVLFLCVHNAGRSQMAAGWMRHLAGDHVDVYSGGSEPAASINGSAVEVMAEVGIDIRGELPQPWADEIVRAADVVVTMGCGDACPIFPGKRYIDWELDDPAGRPLDDVRPIRDEIGRRVRTLLDELGIEPRS